MKNEIDIIDTITKGSYENSLILTYNCSLEFYENIILKSLWNKGCYNNIILMDSGRYEDLVKEESGKINYCGSRYYVCEGVKTRGAFHPKIILLTSEKIGKLFIGSGNSTFLGYGKNYELFNEFDYSEKNNQHLYIFQQVMRYMEMLEKKFELRTASKAKLKIIRETTPWLNDNKSTSSEEKFIHNLDSSILDQVFKESPQDIKEIVIVAPYFDSQLKAIEKIQNHYPRAKITIITQSENTNFPVGYFFSRRKYFKNVSLHKFIKPLNEGRALHAKFFYFTNGKEETLLSGSSNASRIALESKGKEGNVETGIFIRQKSKNKLGYLWQNILTEKEITRKEEIQTIIYEDVLQEPKSDYKIRIVDAWYKDRIIFINYKTDVYGKAELFLNNKPSCGIRLDREGHAIVPINSLKYYDNSDSCTLIQIKIDSKFSNIIWLSSTETKTKLSDKLYINKQISYLFSCTNIKDIGFVRWLAELSPSLQLKGTDNTETIRAISLNSGDDEEEIETEIEMPENLFYVEEKNDSYLLAQNNGSKESINENETFYAIINSIFHSLKESKVKIKVEKNSREIDKNIDVAREDVVMSDIRDKLLRRINRIIDKQINKYEYENKLDLSDTLSAGQFLAALVWFLKGIEIGTDEDRYKIFIGSKRYIETSLAVLRRMWVDTNSEDYMEKKKGKEDYVYIKQLDFILLGLVLISFNAWVIFNKEALATDMEKYQRNLLEIYFSMIGKIKQLPKDVLDEIFLNDKAVNMNQKLIGMGCDFEIIDFKKLIYCKVTRDQIIQTFKNKNNKRERSLSKKKKGEAIEINSRLLLDIDNLKRQEKLLRSGFGSILDYQLYSNKAEELTRKLEENKKLIELLDTGKEDTEATILPQEIENYFHFK